MEVDGKVKLALGGWRWIWEQAKKECSKRARSQCSLTLWNQVKRIRTYTHTCVFSRTAAREFWIYFHFAPFLSTFDATQWPRKFESMKSVNCHRRISRFSIGQTSSRPLSRARWEVTCSSLRAPLCLSGDTKCSHDSRSNAASLLDDASLPKLVCVERNFHDCHCGVLIEATTCECTESFPFESVRARATRWPTKRRKISFPFTSWLVLKTFVCFNFWMVRFWTAI